MLCVLSQVSCGKDSSKSSSDSNTPTPDMVRTVIETESKESVEIDDASPVQEITDIVNALYSNCEALFRNDEGVYMGYCTRDFRTAYFEYLDSVEGIGEIDYNFWLHSQEMDNPKIKIDNIKMISKDQAEVYLTISDFDNSVNKSITLVFYCIWDSSVQEELWQVGDIKDPTSVLGRLLSVE